MKLSTKLKYKRILMLLKKGRDPKEIARYLDITAHVVYNVCAWRKKIKKNKRIPVTN